MSKVFYNCFILMMTVTVMTMFSTEAFAADDGSHETGVPIDFMKDLAFFSLVVFVLFLFVLKKAAWGPLNEALNEREANIRKDINDAEQARVKAEEMLAEHQKQLAATQDQVQEIIAEAHRDADEVRQKLMAAAQREVEDLKHRTLEDMERAKGQAIKELFDCVSDQVALATEHVLGRALQGADQDRLIDDALAQLPDKG